MYIHTCMYMWSVHMYMYMYMYNVNVYLYLHVCILMQAPSLIPAAEEPVDLSSVLASSSLPHRPSRRVVNPDLRPVSQLAPPWGDKTNREQWKKRLAIYTMSIFLFLCFHPFYPIFPIQYHIIPVGQCKYMYNALFAFSNQVCMNMYTHLYTMSYYIFLTVTSTLDLIPKSWYVSH